MAEGGSRDEVLGSRSWEGERSRWEDERPRKNLITTRIIIVMITGAIATMKLIMSNLRCRKDPGLSDVFSGQEAGSEAQE